MKPKSPIRENESWEEEVEKRRSKTKRAKVNGCLKPLGIYNGNEPPQTLRKKH